MRSMMETMKKQQAQRGISGLETRLAHRAATHKSWRQMKGMQLVMHEINHPGNKPFMIGLGVTVSLFMYAYFKGLGSETAKQESKYWQRFHAGAGGAGHSTGH
jgi:hypothetical protein